MAPLPRPRSARLADGREILYFDDAGRDEPRGPRVPPPDRRAAEPRPAPGTLRHDPLLREWIIVAPHRQGRTHLPPTRDCPLCPSGVDVATEVPAERYDVVVFENRFPSLPAIGPGGEAAGRSEVICYADDHEAQLADLDDERLGTIAEALAHRETALAAAPSTAAVFIFENRGEEIGVTLHHPHGQLYAYPFVPPRLARMAEVAEGHLRATSRCLGCELLADELADGRRIVAADADAVAYVPRAARWPYEVHVVPRRHVAALRELKREERHAVVRRQADALRRLDRLFDRRVPSMAGWFSAPRDGVPAAHHLRLEIVSPQRDVGKLKFLASSESLMGGFINDVVPEEAAARLRSAEND